MTSFTIDDFRWYIGEEDWTFAKTMPDHPHWYTLRKDWPDDAAFCAAVLFIREHGTIEYFYRKPFTVFAVDEWVYWTMGNALDVTARKEQRR